MKKITFLLLFGFLWSWVNYGQVTIGEQSGTTSYLPHNGLWGYSYSQQLIYNSEINASGDITSISFYFVSGSNTAPSNQWTVYLGHSSKTQFESATDWVPVSNLTTVFSGTVTFPSTGSWMTVNFTTPFSYNNIDNLVVGVVEFAPGYGSTLNYGKIADVSNSNRGIYYYEDNNAVDPTSPPAAKGRANYINNLILGGIQQPCPNPSDLTVTDVTATSANLSWTANGTETQWEVIYGPFGFDPLTSGTSEIVNNNPNLTLSGLTPNTPYQYYVTALCSDNEQSGLIGPLSFNTSCVPSSAPFSEGFETGYAHAEVLAKCWSQQDLSGSGKWMVNSTNTSYNRTPRTGSYNITLGYSNTDWIFYPLELEGNTPYELKFYARQDATVGAKIEAAFGSSNTAAAMTNPILAATSVVNGDYQEFKNFFTPATSGTFYIGIKATLTSSPYYISVDDISVEVASGCLPPSTLTVTSVTENSASLTWMESGSATQWEVIYGPTGFDPALAGTTVIANTNPEIILSGLTPNTQYDFYVSAVCGAGDESDLEGPQSFETLCTSAAIPYVLDFESAVVPNLPDCTTRENLGTGNNWVTATYTSGGFNGKVLKYGYNANAANAWFFTQGIELEAGTSYQISYLYGNNSSSYIEKMKVAYGTQPLASAMTNLLADHPNITGVGNATTSEVVFTVPANGVYYFGFNAYSDANRLNLYVDDINVDLAPSCPAPTNPMTTNITSTSATIAWTPGLTETEWEVIYGPANFDPQTEGTSFTVSNDPETTITGLTTDTNYDFYVKAICGTGDESVLSGALSFFTGYCQVSTTYPGDYLSSVISSGAITNVTYSATSQPAGSYADETNQVFQASNSQEITLTTTYVGGTNGVNVWVDWNNNLLFDDSEMVSSAVNSNTKTLTVTVPADAEMGDYRMRVRALYGNLPPACGNVLYGTTVDFKLTVMAPPSCPAPTALTVSSITEDTATVTWTAGATETEWVVLYGDSGFDPTTDGTEVSNITTTETVLSGLASSTNFDVYVKAVCGVGNESTWTGPVSFSTQCAPMQTPWSEDFESGTANTNIVPALNCWAQEFVTGQYNWKFVSTNGSNNLTPHSGSLMAEFRNTNSGSSTKLITPSMDLTSLNAPQLTFYFANENWFGDIDELRVYYKSSVANQSWTLIPGAVYSTEHATWEKVEIILPEAVGATDYVIAFEGTSDYARGLNLDDVAIIEASSCPDPSNLAVSNTSVNTADVSWTSNGTETEWIVLYGETGFDPSTAGTEVTVNNNPETTLTGLLESTSYDVYVKAVCNAGDESDMVGPVMFTTQCSPTTVPYVLDFETANVPDLPACTSKENVGSGNDWVTQVYNENGMSGNVLRYGYSSNPANAWFYTQGIEMQAGAEYAISYKYFGSAAWPEKMKVAYGLSPNAVAMTEQLIDQPNINSAGEMTANFSVDADGVYYFGFNVYSDADQNYLYVDDINIVEIGAPVCDPATDVTVTNITHNEATISWTASTTATEGYDVNVFLQGANPEVDTPITTESVGAGITTADITGLEPGIFYDVYVISNCANGNTAMSEVVTFSTNTVGIDDNTLGQVSYFPNPVTHSLTLTAASSIENVTVFNLLGQLVLKVSPNGTTAELDMSSLSSGTYVLKVNVADAVSTFKIVKE